MVQLHVQRLRAEVSMGAAEFKVAFAVDCEKEKLYTGIGCGVKRTDVCG